MIFTIIYMIFRSINLNTNVRWVWIVRIFTWIN